MENSAPQLKLFAELVRVYKISVMGKRHMPLDMTDYERLRIDA